LNLSLFVSGASTIRGYRLEDRFIQESRGKVDRNMVFYFAGIASNRYVSFKTNTRISECVSVVT